MVPAEGRAIGSGSAGASTCALAATGSPTRIIDGASTAAINRKKIELRRLMRAARLGAQRWFGQGTNALHDSTPTRPRARQPRQPIRCGHRRRKRGRMLVEQRAFHRVREDTAEPLGCNLVIAF